MWLCAFSLKVRENQTDKTVHAVSGGGGAKTKEQALVNI